MALDRYSITYDGITYDIEVVRTRQESSRIMLFGRLDRVRAVGEWPSTLAPPGVFKREEGGEVVIEELAPNEYLYIEEIGAFAFDGDVKCSILELPSNCTTIRNKAFYFNESITKVKLDFSLSTIEEYAVAGNNGLTEGFIGNSSTYETWNGILYKGTTAVLGKNASGSISFKNETTAIGNRAFAFCDRITSVTIPNTVTEIGRYAFSDCTGLKEITIPSTVEVVEYGAFFGCSNVSVVGIGHGEDEQSLKGLSFGGMPDLKVVMLPNTVTSIGSVIGEEAFSGRHKGLVFSLSDMEGYSDDVLDHLPGRIETEPIEVECHVGEYTYTASVSYGTRYSDVLADAEEAALENLPEGTTIDGWYYDSTLKSEVGAGDLVESETDTVDIYAKYTVPVVDGIYRYVDIQGKEDEIMLTEVIDWNAIYVAGSVVEIPSSITVEEENLSGNPTEVVKNVVSLGARLFEGQSRLTGIVLPNGLRSIGKSAFAKCTNLSSIRFKEEEKKPALSMIGARAFEGDGITELILPDSVSTIRQGAFMGCKNLTRVVCGKKLTSVGIDEGSNRGCFEGCDSLEEVRIDTIAHWNAIDFGYSTCNPLSNGASLYVGKSEEPVETLNSGNLKTRQTIISITVVDGVEKTTTTYKEVASTEIKPFQYCGCGSLATIDLTGSLIGNIGDEAFSSCGALGTVVLGNGNISNIGRASFSCLERLTSVTIPDTVTGVGSFAFNGCGLETIVIGIGLSILAPSIFSNCTSLGSVTIPSTICRIGESAFSGCSGLTSVTFQNPEESRCDYIEKYAFYACGLVTIGGAGNAALPLRLRDIGERVFARNANLTSAILPDGLETLTSNVFEDCPNLPIVRKEDGYGYIGNWIFEDRLPE